MKNNKKYKFKVRLHLAQGKHFNMFQVKQIDNDKIKYYDPSKVNLLLGDCRLVNDQEIANRIYNGKTKSVCAWVLCNDVTEWDIGDIEQFNDNYTKIHYNPRVSPHWSTYSESGDKHTIIDSNTYSHIVSIGRQLYV